MEINNKHLIAVFIVVGLSLFLLYLDKITENKSLTGLAIAAGHGCCERFCEVTTEQQCYEGKFHIGESCDKIEQCNIGCCIDKEGYCLSNYIKANCDMYGYTFIRKECPEVAQCVMPIPSFIVREEIGIRVNIDSSIQEYYDIASGIELDNDEILFDVDDAYGARYAIVSPMSGNRGTIFNIQYVISQFADISNVRIILRDDASTIAELILFDDGAHNDANENDGVYGNKWDSASLAGFDGFKRIILDGEITGKDGAIKFNENIFDFIVSASSECLPITIRDDMQDKKNIIFLGNRYKDIGGVEKLKLDTRNNYNNILVISPFRENFGNLSFYIIEKNFDFNLDNDILNSIKAECNFFNEAEDLAIVFDYGEMNCRKLAGGNIFTLSPETVYFFDSPFSLDEAIANPCNIVNTYEEYLERMIAQANSAISRVD